MPDSLYIKLRLNLLTAALDNRLRDEEQRQVKQHRDNHNIIQLANHRDKVRDKIKRQQQVSHCQP